MQLPSKQRKAVAQEGIDSRFTFKPKPNLREYVEAMSDDSFD